MTNNEILNAITVLRDVLNAAGLAYQNADIMIKDLKENPVYPEIEIERAFCAGFVCNLKSMKDFEGNSILKKYDAYKKSGYFTIKPIGQ